MKNNWGKTKLGSFSPFIYGKGLLQKDRVKGNVPVFGSNGITDWHNESYVKNAGVIIGRKGSIGIVKLSKIPFWPIDTTFYIQDEPEKRNLLFTYYLLKTIDFERISSDSAVPGLNRDAAHSLEIKIPSLPEQKRIADILSSFDDKIELLQKQNKILEDMAKAIFRSWFVDFDIVKAKQRKEKKSKILNEYKITEEIYNLFPNSFKNSELGKIPKGWEVKKIGDIIDIASGKRPNKTSTIETKLFNIPVYGGNGIKWYSDKSLFNNKIIITGRVGTLGEVYRIYTSCWVSDNALVFIAKENLFEYIYNILSKLDFHAFNRGSTQPLITQTDIKNILLLFNDAIILKYHNIASDLYNKIESNKKQIQTLSEIRDTLLPKLISGGIRV